MSIKGFALYLWSRYSIDQGTWNELSEETQEYWLAEARRAFRFLGYKDEAT